jgi:hypothetical protein
MQNAIYSPTQPVSREASSRAQRVFVVLMVAALAGTVWWSLDFSATATVEHLGAYSPVGFYASFGYLAAPIAAVGGLLVGLILARRLLRYRGTAELVWLFWLVVVQWIAACSLAGVWELYLD